MNAALLYYDNGLVMQYIETSTRGVEVEGGEGSNFLGRCFLQLAGEASWHRMHPGASPTGLVAVQKNGSFWSFLARISPYFFTKLEDLP